MRGFLRQLLIRRNAQPALVTRGYFRFFFVFSIGVPSVIFYTPLRYKISIKSFPWDCMFYEIIFIYVFVSTILQKRGIDDIRIFRKILIVSTILIFCFILVFFYFSDFDRGFIFLGGLTVI